jgi:zinc protease
MDNGLTVLSERRGLGPVVFCGVVYRVGSRDERPGITGISHLLEHMMFKGTKKFGKGEVAALVERNGGELNAFTSEDVTMYYEVFARDRWELALDIEAERMVNLAIDSQELEAERQVILEERAMYLDMAGVELSEELVAATFRESPYRWPIIGWEGDIRAITREDVMEHYRRYYSPTNAALVVVGDIEGGEVFAAAQRAFGGARPATTFERRIPKEPELRTRTRVELARPGNLPYLEILFRASEIRTRDSETLYLLANLLSGTKTSRLDLALLETHKAGEVRVQYHAKNDPSTFTISVEGNPEVSLDVVEEILWEELDKLASREIDEEERERALNQVEAHHLFAMQSPSTRGFVLGWHEALGRVEYADEILGRLRTVTAAEIREVAARCFRRDRCGVARLTPISGGGLAAAAGSVGRPSAHPSGLALLGSPHARVSPVHGVFSERNRFRTGLAKVPAVKSFALPNGMRIHFQRDDTDPVVSLTMLFHAGACFDPEEKRGLSTLTAATLERGTRALDFVEFSRRFERIGTELSFSAGTELVQCDANFLSRHFATGLSLIADLLDDPGFRESDLAVARSLARNDIEAREEDLDDFTEDLFLQGVARNHPYGRLPHGTRAGIDSVDVSDLRRFFELNYRAETSHVAVVGDFDDVATERLLRSRFGAKRNSAERPAAVPPLAPLPAEGRLVRTRADKSQAKIYLGGTGYGANDADRLAAITMNQILGGSSIRSRLGDEIRDKRGLAYAVSSRNYERSRGGFFFVYMGTRPENVKEAVAAIQGELAAITRGVTPAELDDARNYLTGSFPLRFTTYGRLSRFWARSSFYGWPDDYLATYVDRVRELGLDDIRSSAQRIVANARFLAVAGPVDESLTPVATSNG